MAKKATRKKAARRGQTRASNPLSRKVKRSEAVWLDGPVPAGYWQYAENQKLYLTWLGQQLGFRKLDDYYRLITDDFKTNRGSGVLLHCWGGSSVRAVMETFPDHDWKEWLFASCPRQFWDDSRNHRRYMEWLGEQIGVQEPNDWYRVTNADFRRHKGGAFLLRFDSTISAAVKSCFPKHKWNEWMFGKTPKGYWENRDNRVRYLKWLGRLLGFRKMIDWYRLTRDDFEKNHGNQLMKYYHGSPLAAVLDCFPQKNWEEWKFARVPVAFWKKKANRDRYFAWLAKRLKLKTAADWQRVRRTDLKQNYGGGLLAEYRSIETLLKTRTGKQRRK
ncbi:MAG: hypothetical protein ACYTGL_05555 [Planctomycetota bacterium]|jgi:hypothetical protein